MAARPRLAAAAAPGRLGHRLKTALFRSVHRGRVRWALPHVLVEDGPELVVLYIPPGTVGRKPRRPIIEDPSQLRTLRWDHVDHVWTGSHALRLLRPGAAHCLYLFWSERDWAFEGWYVNLQAPIRRTAISFDTRDHALDIVVPPDGSWRWKDATGRARSSGRRSGAPATGSLQLPANFVPSHETAGLPGFPALDVFAAPNTTVLAPADGVVDRLTGKDPKLGGPRGGPYGWSIYLTTASGRFYMTHFATRNVSRGQRVSQGEPIGTVCDSAVSGKPGTSHIHHAKKRT